MENSGTNVVNDSEMIQNSQKIVRFFVHKRGTKDYEENKTKIMEEWYDIIKYLSEKKSPSMQLLITETVFSTLRGFLVEKDRNVRLTTLKIFRYLLDSPKAFELIKNKQIYILIARALDREHKPEIFDENIQILKLIRKWIEVDPSPNFWLTPSSVSLNQARTY
jgi:Rapamycin-insensitive companion of mTOR, N-term